MKNILTGRRKEELQRLCQTLEIEFSDVRLLHQALIHTSFANEFRGSELLHNERLEFLGDAVLDLVISEDLFRRFPDLPEGELTKARSTIVCEGSLAGRAAEFQLGHYLLLGKGEANSGGHKRNSLLADAFEAVIGAIYLDRGFEAAARFVCKQLRHGLQLVEKGDYARDYKTILQEVVQKNSESKIVYLIVNESGPDHAKQFETAVAVNGEVLGKGAGKSKKEAEQQAAREALIHLRVIPQTT